MCTIAFDKYDDEYWCDLRAMQNLLLEKPKEDNFLSFELVNFV